MPGLAFLRGIQGLLTNGTVVLRIPPFKDPQRLVARYVGLQVLLSQLHQGFIRAVGLR